MSEENQTTNKEKGIESIRGGIIVLIIIDFILFFFSFFNIPYLKFINENKGIPFTLFLFVTLWIIYLRIPKKGENEKIGKNKQK